MNGSYTTYFTSGKNRCRSRRWLKRCKLNREHSGNHLWQHGNYGTHTQWPRQEAKLSDVWPAIRTQGFLITFRRAWVSWRQREF